MQPMGDSPAGHTASLGPVELDSQLYDALPRLTYLVAQLLVRTLASLGDTSEQRLEALSLESSDYPLFRSSEREELALAAVMIRADVIISSEGPRLIELNCGGGIGGAVEQALLTRSWLNAYQTIGLKSFDGEDALLTRAEMYRNISTRERLPPAVVIVGTTRDIPGGEHQEYFDVQLDSMRAVGIAAEFSQPEDLDDFLSNHGSTWRLGLNHFTVTEWREHHVSTDPVQRAIKDERLFLSSQSAYLLENKRLLALLSSGAPYMTAGERKLVQSFIPWTRSVEDNVVESKGKNYNLPDLLLKEQEKFVLKPEVGMQGKGVLIGRYCDPKVWRTCISEAIERRNYVAQHFVESREFSLNESDPISGNIIPSVITPVFSPFVFDGRSGGCVVRYLPHGSSGVVSVSGHGAHVNVAMRGL